MSSAWAGRPSSSKNTTTIAKRAFMRSHRILRRGTLVIILGSLGAALWVRASPVPQSAPPIKGWQKGKGWGWIWGKDDEVGSLNAMTDATRAAALSLAKTGEVFDLGLTYSRNSFKWAGHSPREIITFRSPDGIARLMDPDPPPAASNPD